MDGLAGPIKSVSSAITQSGVKWQQPDGPLLVAPVWCMDCEYGPDEAKTKSGQLVEGKFYGEVVPAGSRRERTRDRSLWYSASTGELQRHEVMGLFGRTEQKVYIGGKLRFRSTFSSDQYGHLLERVAEF
jgi:hypothetical protein